MPVEQVGEDAAEKHARDAAAREDEAEDAHRLGALGGLGEEQHDQGERHRGDDRAADALYRACRDEEALRGRETARERGDREERDPGEEHPARPVQVAEPAAEEQEAAEGEEIGVDDPRQGGLREPEVVADRRQRDIHDRPVEHDHQVAQAEDDQGKPACARIGHGHPGLLPVVSSTL